MNTAELTVEEIKSDLGPIFQLSGDMDMTSIGTLREPLLSTASKCKSPFLVVDLSRVSYIDSAGLSLLVETRKRLPEEARPLAIVLSKGKQPERVLKLVRFDSIMRLVYFISDLKLGDVHEA